MRIVFDLDGVICSNTDKKYEEAKPINETINLLSSLKEQGHFVIIRTARSMGYSNGDVNKAINNLYVFTYEQLKQWGVQYDELHFGKPYADLYVDDKAFKFDNNIEELKQTILNIESKL